MSYASPEHEVQEFATTNDIREYAREGEAADIELRYFITNAGRTNLPPEDIRLAAGCTVKIIQDASIRTGKPFEDPTIMIAEFTMTDGAITVGLYEDSSETIATELITATDITKWLHECTERAKLIEE